MAFGSDIEWTESTWNPVTGCDKVSPGCKHCYAERMAERLQAMGQANYKDGFKLTLQPHMLELPLRWKKPRKIFVNSMSDLFHKDVPFEYIAAVFGVMAATPWHTYIVCTKRAKRMREWFRWYEGESGAGGSPNAALHSARALVGGQINRAMEDCLERDEWPLPNVWLLVSTENQETFDERVPELLECSAAVRGVSAEPLLGPITFWPKTLGQGADCRECGPLTRVDEEGCCPSCGADAMWYGLDWVIVGGESGPRVRPMDPAWVTDIRDQCKAAGVSFFFKQWGGTNKKKAGRTLDGRTWDEMPTGSSRDDGVIQAEPRGVAGDECVYGNNCGRLGCQECQQ